MKLELKYLDPYLSYELNVEYPYVTGKAIDKLIAIDASSNTCFMGFNPWIPINKIKPIFRLLSDLTKEIEHNGEKFIPIDKIFIGHKEEQPMPQFMEYTYKCAKGLVHPVHLQYWITENLFKWHFDVFGLIEAGLAIKKE